MGARCCGFAAGAAEVARDVLQETSSFPYACICEGRIKVSVSVQARLDGRMEKVMLAEAGTNWYEAEVSIEIIMDPSGILNVEVTPLTGKMPKMVQLYLS